MNTEDAVLSPPKRAWDPAAGFHPLMYKNPGRAAIAALFGLPAGVFTMVDLCEALEAAVGITRNFARQVLLRLAEAAVVDPIDVWLLKTESAKPVRRKAVVVHPDRLRAAWEDFDPAAFGLITLRMAPGAAQVPYLGWRDPISAPLAPSRGAHGTPRSGIRREVSTRPLGTPRQDHRANPLAIDASEAQIATERVSQCSR